MKPANGGPALPPASVFAGRGMFTVERPGDTAGLRLDYVLEQRAPMAWTTFGGWVLQAETPDQYAYALQFPTQPGDQRALVTNLDPAFLPPGSWPDGWTCMPECYWNADGGHIDHTIEPRLTYGRSVPNMIYQAKQAIGDRWGSIPVVPVIGCYDGSGDNPGIGVRLTVPDYLPDLEAAMAAHPCVVGWAVWRVETLAAADREALT